MPSDARRLLLPAVALSAAVLVAAAEAPSAQAPAVLGAFRGRSTCTVRPSPCNDEVVVYTIRPDSQYRDSIAIDADKIVQGQRDFMGTLRCGWNAPTLACPMRGDSWRFTLRGDTLAGTLTLADGRKYRDVLLTRSAPAR